MVGGTGGVRVCSLLRSSRMPQPTAGAHLDAHQARGRAHCGQSYDRELGELEEQGRASRQVSVSDSRLQS